MRTRVTRRCQRGLTCYRGRERTNADQSKTSRLGQIGVVGDPRDTNSVVPCSSPGFRPGKTKRAPEDTARLREELRILLAEPLLPARASRFVTGGKGHGIHVGTCVCMCVCVCYETSAKISHVGKMW